ncbi:hypothetical protein BG000_010793 [Podila horticola]|nr:hypothetical protein BG000_010793 [Podila horticola]
MPVSAALPSILPAGSLIRLKQLEDQIAYKYSQDRIDQGLDQDGNDIDGYGQSDNDDDDDDNLDQSNTQWLLKQLAKLEETAPPEDEEEETLEDEQQQLSTHNSKTYFSSATTQTVETPQEQAYRRQHELLTERIHDPSFTEGDVGFKTFGSAYLLSKHIALGDIPQLEPWTKSSSSTLPLPKILELGSGTGLVGFTATLFSDPRGPKVTLSDYHPNVLVTLDHNSKLNHLDTRCEIMLLDWRDILNVRKQRDAWQQKDKESAEATVPLPEMAESSRMDLIIGAEVVYDHGHAELVAHVVDEYLKRELISNDTSIPLEKRRPAFHIMFPIRPTHADVIADFDFWMDKMDLVDCREAKEWGREDGETKFLYHWREYVRRDHLGC